jgi:hypothetical protein
MQARSRVALAGLAVAMAACSSGGASTDGGSSDTAGTAAVEVVVADDIAPIVGLSAVTCRTEDTQLIAEGIATSKGDATHYVSVEVRFVDADGVRVELATDSVSDLLVGESARWSATAYADSAADVRRCEVTATVS